MLEAECKVLHKLLEKYSEDLHNINNINILFYSSFIFIVNVLISVFLQSHVYAALFFLLTITSLIVHNNDNIITNTIDKIIIGLIVFYGGFMLFNKLSFDKIIQIFCIVLTFIFCIFVYIYGYLIRNYCFHKNKDIADKYHIAMHIVGLLGHSFIILL